MPGPVIDPNQNPTEGRIGYFRDRDDDHIKPYLKLDEENGVTEPFQSRYFTCQTKVKNEKSLKFTITEDMLKKALEEAHFNIENPQEFIIEVHIVENDTKENKHPIISGQNVSTRVLFKGRSKKYQDYDSSEIDNIKSKSDEIKKIKKSN